MINHIVLDVFIGLIFIYLLYSLYASVAMEVLASTLGLRAENLHYTLKRMLMDEKKSSNTFNDYLLRTANSFTQIFGRTTNLSNRELFDNFINQPSIKYLGNGGSLITNRTPSYIKAETFSKALIDVIMEENDEAEVLPETKMELGLLEIKDKSETGRQIYKMFKDADGDMQRFKLSLEQWYNNTMERASGWYKKNTQIFIFFFGIALTLVFDLDTIQIAKKLSHDEQARNALVKMAQDLKPNSAGEIPVEDLIKKSDEIRLSVLEIPEKNTGSLAGYILTILALSLGAPFWFDLLNKFVKLRSGIKPVEQDSGLATIKRNNSIHRVG